MTQATEIGALVVAVIAVLGLVITAMRFLVKLGGWLRAIEESGQTMERNTAATQQLTRQVAEMNAMLRDLKGRVVRLEARIS